MHEDLNAILRAIREVEVSLERRAARAQGTLVMIWGLVASSIFAFYQLVEWNPAPYVAALDGWVNWVWIGPMLLGYVASALVGARIGRLGATPGQRRHIQRGLIPAAVIALLVSVLVLMGRYHYVYGGATLVAGVSCIAFAWNAPRTSARTTSFGIGGAMALVGVALLPLADAAWAAGAAALTFLVGYLLLGTVMYRLGR